MQTLILPGFSSSNKEWVDATAQNLDVQGVIRPFYWMHWTDETQKFDAQEKADLIVKHVKGDKVNIIAKSIGTLVASLVCKAIPYQIEKIIFCGIPLNDLSLEEVETIKSVMHQNKDKIIALQNFKDPHGRFEDLEGFENVVMTERDDHNYPFYSEFQKFLIK